MAADWKCCPIDFGGMDQEGANALVEEAQRRGLATSATVCDPLVWLSLYLDAYTGHALDSALAIAQRYEVGFERLETDRQVAIDTFRYSFAEWRSSTSPESPRVGDWATRSDQRRPEYEQIADEGGRGVERDRHLAEGEDRWSIDFYDADEHDANAIVELAQRLEVATFAVPYPSAEWLAAHMDWATAVTLDSALAFAQEHAVDFRRMSDGQRRAVDMIRDRIVRWTSRTTADA